MGKNVLSKCYGDGYRQEETVRETKEGKKKMKAVGSVETPEAFLAVLKMDDDYNTKRRNHLISPLLRRNLMDSMYVHIPFCNRICTYCDFNKVLIKISL